MEGNDNVFEVFSQSPCPKNCSLAPNGRLAGFLVQFLYGPLVNQNRLAFMFGLASMFAVSGAIAASRTYDTTNKDLNDCWDGDARESKLPRASNNYGSDRAVDFFGAELAAKHF